MGHAKVGIGPAGHGQRMFNLFKPSRYEILKRGSSSVRIATLFRFLPFLLVLNAHATTISFDEIFNDPDNVELNLRYAEQQQTLGDIASALSAVERALSITPLNVEVRLLRVRLLMQLGNTALAESEVVGLLKQPLPVVIRAELVQLERQLKANKARDRIVYNVGIQQQFDDNILAFPKSGSVEISPNGQSFYTQSYQDSIARSEETSDRIRNLSAGVSIERDLMLQNQGRVFASVNLGRTSSFETDLRDQSSRSLSVGASAVLEDVTGAFSLAYAAANRDSSDDFESPSAQVTFTRNQTQWGLNARKVNLDYAAGSEDLSSKETGWFLARSIELSERLTLQLSGGQSHSRAQSAASRAKGKVDSDADSFNASLSYLPRGDLLLSSQLSQYDTDYRQQVFPNPRIRADRLRTAGVSATWQIRQYLGLQGSLLARIAATRVRNESNVMVHDWQKNLIEIGLTYQMEISK